MIHPPATDDSVLDLTEAEHAIDLAATTLAQHDWAAIANHVDAGRPVIHADRLRPRRSVLAAQVAAAAQFLHELDHAR